MADNESSAHIIKYRTYFMVLITLLVFTGMSVMAAGIEFGRLSVVIALLLAATKSSLVLWYFMHLKFENKMLGLMVALVLFVFVVVMIITFLDYSFQ